MKTIISFVSILVAIVVIISGCTPGSIANLGVSLIDSHMKTRAEDTKARRQAKYIAEEIKNTKQYTKRDFKTPDRIVRINQQSEVYMYNVPKDKIEILAFINNELQGTGVGNRVEGKKPDEQLRQEFINTFPCYAHLRPIQPGDTATAGITPAAAPEPTPAPAKTIPLGSIPTTGFISR